MKIQRNIFQSQSGKNTFDGTLLNASTIIIASILAASSTAIAQTNLYPGLTPIASKTIDPQIFLTPKTFYTAKFTCGLWDQSKTLAQLNKGIGAGPPLTPEHSTFPGPAIASYYQDFQPGIYSTALNIFNPGQRDVIVQVKVASESLSSSQTIATLSIGSLNNAKIGCNSLIPLLPDTLEKGELVEGFFHIARYKADIQVQAVYSYSTMAAFQEFRGGFVDAAGVIPGEDIGYYPANAGAGAGAGGLGLGGSVDVETIQPWVSEK